MTWDILLTIRLTHVHQSLSLRLIECAHHNVLLEHSELPCVLPFDVHLDLGHSRVLWAWVGWVAHKILVIAPVPLELI